MVTSLQADSASGAALLGLLGIVLQNTNVLLGLTCSPISVVEAGGSSCSAKTVCCENNSYVSVMLCSQRELY